MTCAPLIFPRRPAPLKTRYWDLRQSNPAFTYTLSERLYAMDVKHPLLVAATADRQLYVFNLANPQQPYKTLPSPLKWQTRVVRARSGGSGSGRGPQRQREGLAAADTLNPPPPSGFNIPLVS